MTYDVAVVGAGPGGSTAAYTLARAGLSVALIDKATFPRQKACGGGLPSRILTKKGLPDFRAALEAPSSSLIFECCDTGDRAYMPHDGPIVWQARRFVLDKTIFDCAVEAGATPMLNTNVRSWDYADGGVVLSTADKKEVRAKTVIGAGGSRDLIAKVVRAREGMPPDWGRTEAHVATRIEPEVGEDIVEEYYGKERAIWIHFNPKGVRGYGWVFPKKSTLNIGVAEFVIGKEDIDLREVTKEYIKLLEKENLIPPGLDKVKIDGAYLPIGGPLPKTYTDRCLLVGDSAGFPSALTGEGMWYAIESGRCAGEALSACLAKGDVSKQALQLYEQTWQASFGKELYTHLKWTKTFYKIPKRIVRMAARDKPLVTRAIRTLTGESERNKNDRYIRTRVAINALRFAFRRTPTDVKLPGHPAPAEPLV
jgi:geranylgeranyl reductase family protein